VDRSVVGNIGGIIRQGSDYYLSGWACAKTFEQSIDVHFYTGGSFLFAASANFPSEAAVAEQCQASGSNYRYWVQIPPWVMEQHHGEPISAYGISPVGLENRPLENSGHFSVPGALTLPHREYIYLGDRLLAIDSQ
jgi:hypothetical protein